MADVSRRRTAVLAALLLCGAASAAPPPLQGRWQGEVDVPGGPIRLVLDLAPDARPGHPGWSGSAILPGHGIKGAALGDLAVSALSVSFTIPATLAAPDGAPPRVHAHLADAATLKGRFEQAGNAAPFTLKRTGPAQVEEAPHSTAVDAALQGEWKGSFELGGYPRQVTLTLTGHGEAAATAELLIVGRKSTRAAVDIVIQQDHYLRLESHAVGLVFEGQWIGAAGQPERIDGSFELGPYQLPSSLSRAAPAAGGSS